MSTPAIVKRAVELGIIDRSEAPRYLELDDPPLRRPLFIVPKPEDSTRTVELSPALVALFRERRARQAEYRLAAPKWVEAVDDDGEPVSLSSPMRPGHRSRRTG